MSFRAPAYRVYAKFVNTGRIVFDSKVGITGNANRNCAIRVLHLHMKDIPAS